VTHKNVNAKLRAIDGKQTLLNKTPTQTPSVPSKPSNLPT
jgi:hypothetical protein